MDRGPPIPDCRSRRPRKKRSKKKQETKWSEYEPAFEDPEEIRSEFYAKQLSSVRGPSGDVPTDHGASDVEEDEGEEATLDDVERYLGYPLSQIGDVASSYGWS